jgi:alkylhydroperoxidase family enzyme
MTEPARPDDVLVALLRQDAVPMATLHERYGPLLELVRVLIGVIPNCDAYLEIWPPAFRTYNVMVPNFLNLPFSLFGLGAPKHVVGIAMYVASRSAECPYCTAHSCSFAVRRGATPEQVALAMTGSGDFTPGELAAIAVARSLGRIPCELTGEERASLYRNFEPVAAEWIVLGIVMMGFLNKFMDAIGVELEAPALAETTSTLGAGWSSGKAGRGVAVATSEAGSGSDSLFGLLSVLRRAPAALRLDRQWQRGVPDRWPAAGEFLRQQTGHDFPVLSRLRNRRVVRAASTMLRENFNSANTVVGLETKVLAGMVFTTVIADQPLAAEVRILGAHLGLSAARLDEAARFAVSDDADPPASDPKQQAALLLARAASPSPARITSGIVAQCRAGGLSAQAVVELIAWISVLQMLHRLTCFFAPE